MIDIWIDSLFNAHLFLFVFKTIFIHTSIIYLSLLFTLYCISLRAGGGVADLLATPSWTSSDRGHYMGRLFFDISFFILIVVILVAIVSGIIIDQ